MSIQKPSPLASLDHMLRVATARTEWMVPFLTSDPRPACDRSAKALAALQARMRGALAGESADIDAKVGLLEDFVMVYGPIVELLRQSADGDIRHKGKNAGQIIFNVQCCLQMVSIRRAAAA